MKDNNANQRLIQAFFHLIESTHYSKISVTDLITEAGCSRTTFYRHYTDVLDMYNKICEQIINAILKEFAVNIVSEKSSLPELFDVFCEKLESQKHYMKLLCGKNGDRKCFEIGFKLSRTLSGDFNSFLNERENFILKFIVMSCISSYVKSLMDETEFDRNYLVFYRKMLTETQKAGDLFE